MNGWMDDMAFLWLLLGSESGSVNQKDRGLRKETLSALKLFIYTWGSLTCPQLQVVAFPRPSSHWPLLLHPQSLVDRRHPLLFRVSVHVDSDPAKSGFQLNASRGKSGAGEDGKLEMTSQRCRESQQRAGSVILTVRPFMLDVIWF